MAAPFTGEGSRVAEMGAAIKTRISRSASKASVLNWHLKSLNLKCGPAKSLLSFCGARWHYAEFPSPPRIAFRA